MKEENPFQKHFDYGSFLPLFIFILGFYTIYLFILKDFSQGFFVMLLAFIIYVINNTIINLSGFTTVFNEYLEDMATFLSFGISSIIFGLVFYGEDPVILGIVLFYAICLVLALSRNWIMRLKNSVGFPIPLNGLFFPLIFYIFSIYLKDPGNSIFLIYYFLVAGLSVSHINFLGYNESKERVKVIEVGKKPVHKKDKDLGIEYLED